MARQYYSLHRTQRHGNVLKLDDLTSRQCAEAIIARSTGLTGQLPCVEVTEKKEKKEKGNRKKKKKKDKGKKEKGKRKMIIGYPIRVL